MATHSPERFRVRGKILVCERVATAKPTCAEETRVHEAVPIYSDALADVDAARIVEEDARAQYAPKELLPARHLCVVVTCPGYLSENYWTSRP